MSEFIAKNKLILSFLTLNITNGTAGGLLQITVPLYAMSLNATTAQIGMIRGVAGLGFLLLVIPAGFLVDHYGAKKLFLIGSLTVTLTTFALVLAKTPALVAVLMGAQGFFRSLRMTAMNSSFFGNLKTMGLEKAGWFKGSLSIGFTFLGPLLGGYLAKSTPFPLIFELVVLITLLPTALVFFFHKDSVAPSEVPLRETIKAQLHDFNLLLRRRTLYLPLLSECMGASFMSAFSTFTIVIVVRTLNLAPTAASSLLTLEGALFILTVFTAGPLIRRISINRLYLCSFFIISLGAIMLALAGTLFMLALAAVVVGFGLGFNNLATYSQLGLQEGDKGKVVGLFSAATGVGISLGPLLGGVVGHYVGTQLMFIFFVPLIALLSLMTLPGQTGAAAADLPEKAGEAGFNVVE